MIPNIEASYQRIANAVVDSLPDDWQSASLTGIFYYDMISWEAGCRTKEGKLRSFHVSAEMTMAFVELRQKFRDAGERVWGEATFLLDASGKFNMKWSYENCDENGDTIWDEVEWSRRQDEWADRTSEP